jgi:D-beta-D-heptose 7-phosphate kinase/D-beta-D-heptose 1-phosphate adenosyltransferase
MMVETARARPDYNLPEILDRCRGREVWVIGDLMLDEYVHGPVERISPEAPVPVVRVRDVEYRLGGAANVARQVAVLGARAVLGGIVGDDTAGQRLLSECARAGIDTRAVLAEGSGQTTRKLRVLGHGQQLLRLDWEGTGTCTDATAERLLRELRSGANPDIIIVSDYAKGVLSDAVLEALVGAARAVGCRVLVDPKRRDFAAYRGASMLTPNLGELALAAGTTLDVDDPAGIAAAARRFIEAARLESMVVTLGDRGMLLVPASGPERHVPAIRRPVSDVTGAGDTVVAVLGATLAAGAGLDQAAEIANAAAGLAVGEVGAVAVEPAQISSALRDLPGGGVLSREALAVRAAGWRVAGKRIVFTNGCFDLLHAGHLSLLHQAAQQGDVLVLAMNSDESVRRLKGPERPIVSAADRAALLSALSCVDAVTIFDEDTPLETLRAVRPHVLVKGQDYGVGNVVGRELVESSGGRVVLVPLMGGKSTSALVEQIRRGRATREEPGP